MARSSKFFKNKETDRIFWVDNIGEEVGVFEFSFDKEKVYNMFSDYPWALTKEEKRIFDEENPFWAEFFADRE